MRLAALTLVLGLALAGCEGASRAVGPAPSPTPSATAVPPRPPTLGAEYADAVCDPKDDTTWGMSQCAQVDVNRGNREVDASFAAVRKATSALYEPEIYDDAAARNAEALSRLDASQRAWITYRDARCASEIDADMEGSIRHIDYPGCLAALDTSRVKQLRYQLLLLTNGEKAQSVPYPEG